MYWEPLSIDEFARYQQAAGKKVVQVDGVWWVEARPFFYRPLFPFAEIAPWSRRYPCKALLGGFMHLVPNGVPANTTMSFFIYDDLQSYSLGKLSTRRRRVTAQGIGNFKAREIKDLDEFVDTAFEVYLSFYERTKYPYRKDRVERERFRTWAKTLYENDKIRKIGAYRGNILSAVEISYRVADVIFGSTLFSDTHSLNLKVTDYLIHFLREDAARTDARYFFVGLPTGKSSLDRSKLMRGCKILRMPAYYKVSPVGLLAARVLMKDSYQKFMRVTSDLDLHERLAPGPHTSVTNGRKSFGATGDMAERP